MKKYITFIVALLGIVFISNSQKVIHLEEAELTFEPSAKVVFEDYANGIIKVRENYAKQFQEDAIRFLTENFDIYRFIRENEEEIDQIEVMVKSSNGVLLAKYSSEGELLGTFQKFKNIPLPADIRNQVFGTHGIGWTMTKNKYTAEGLSNRIDSETYIVHLVNGKQQDRLKIRPNPVTGVASIEYE